jgi:putative ABC transport system ATP-binding protein
MRIDISDLQRTYRDSRGQSVPALTGVELHVASGDFVAVSGPSGCGKSTLLNVIGCLDRPDGGACRLDGEDVATWPEARRATFRNRRLGFVFQSFHLLPFLNVRENVELPLLYARETSGQRAPMEDVLHSIGLRGMENRYPSELSGMSL